MTTLPAVVGLPSDVMQVARMSISLGGYMYSDKQHVRGAARSTA
jgi:hypothetical protein